MQHPSPAISSPSTGFLGPRASPLFNTSIDHHLDGVVINSNDLLRPSMVVARPTQDQAQEAPPKKLSRALEGLAKAHRHIADVRSGADLLLEALDNAVSRRGREAPDKKASDGIVAAAEAMKNCLDALRTVGRELEASGILKGAQHRYEDNQPWGLQPPSVCPDGQVTPYAWKRQIAGQAAASAVERTRLALKSFAEQKKRYFNGVDENFSKRSRTGNQEGAVEDSSLADVLKRIQTDARGMTVTPYVRLEWGKRASCMNLSKAVSDPSQSLASLSSHALSPVKLEAGPSSTPPTVDTSSSKAKQDEKVAVLEVIISGVLRAIVSLHPTGSAHPDAIAIFSPDEEHGVNALHYFRRQFHATSLEHLLHWLYSYRTLFSDPCSECKRMTALDAPSDLLLPPVVRLFHHLRLPTTVGVLKSDKKESELASFHIGCIPKKDLKK